MKKMTPVTGLSAADADKPSLALGDSIYYRHEKHGVAHGVVAAVGRHGVTTDSDGEEHQVLWEHFLGHRKRAERKLSILDRGEDGTIMEDEDGKRVYVRGSLEDYMPSGDKPLTKSDIEAMLAEWKPVPLEPLIAPGADLLAKAQVVRELSAAGFEPMLDYVRDTFGDHFVYRQPSDPVDPVAGPVRDALERLNSVMASQFQGLAAAISMLADRISSQDAMQQTLLAALSEARQPQTFALTLPDVFTKAEAPVIQIDNHIPAQPAPVVHVAAPEVHVAAPSVTVSPVVEPVINVPVPDVTVNVPARETVTTIERDRDGNISRAVQRDVPMH